MTAQTLLVFAHADEAAAFAEAGMPHTVTGIGKINATLALTHALLTAEAPIERVVVLGTAGAVGDDARLDTVYQIIEVVQHDFSLPSPRLELAPFNPGSEAVGTIETAVIATGDVFVQDDAQRAALASAGATLVDMETYAYATVCAHLGVPLQVFKTPSDFADSSTTQSEWDEVVVSNSEQLFAFAQKNLPDLLA